MAQVPSTPTEGGIVRGAGTGFASGDLDPVDWTRHRYKSAPLRLTFRATNRSEAEAWQRELRAKLIELLGSFPERTPLRAETLEIKQYPRYQRERIRFYSRPGVAVVGYLLIPLGRDAPTPP
jgi:hypothetical protein